MPEYLTPGVYIEETSFRSPAIEGVSTTTTAFIGPTRIGPTKGPLQVLTSLSDFEQIYGDGQQLEFDGGAPMDNYMWQAAGAFFAQGGQRLYVQRVYRDGNDPGEASGSLGPPPPAAGGPTLGITSSSGGAASATPTSLTLVAGANLLTSVTRSATTAGGAPTTTTAVNGLNDKDIVYITGTKSGTTNGYYRVRQNRGAGQAPWTFVEADGKTTVDSTALKVDPDITKSDLVQVVTATVTVQPITPGALPQVWSGLPLDPQHTSFGAPDDLLTLFGGNSLDPNATPMPVMITLTRPAPAAPAPPLPPATGLDIAAALGDPVPTAGAPTVATFVANLTGGSDGARPTDAEYLAASAAPDDKHGFNAFNDIDEISIVAAPGSTFGYENGYQAQSAAIQQLLLEHVQANPYSVAVLDSGDGQTMAEVQAMRATMSSDHAAFYYPWVKVMDPISGQVIELPPSGFVAGIYAETDIARGVWKAPANVVVNGALGFEKVINKAQQGVLNPLGINCFRFFEDRGFRLWGARTISSDSQWKYVNVRRYFCYLEHSLDKGTQWVVFEPNGPRTWANVVSSVSDFLFSEFHNGALAGTKPAQAYFVRCDQTTMTQNDLDNGRLVCLVGVAPLYPAEFVIFRIGQWTASTPA